MLKKFFKRYGETVEHHAFHSNDINVLLLLGLPVTTVVVLALAGLVIAPLYTAVSALVGLTGYFGYLLLKGPWKKDDDA